MQFKTFVHGSSCSKHIFQLNLIEKILPFYQISMYNKSMPHRTRLFFQNYTRDSINILEGSLKMIDSGNVAFYKVVAVELRSLLCDITRRHNKIINISLALRLAPNLTLHPLGQNGSFDHALPRIPLDEWLQQPIPTGLTPPITIRDLIRKVCDQQGGAHVDPKPDFQLPDEVDTAAWITTIGSYVAPELKAALLPQND